MKRPENSIECSPYFDSLRKDGYKIYSFADGSIDTKLFSSKALKLWESIKDTEPDSVLSVFDSLPTETEEGIINYFCDSNKITICYQFEDDKTHAYVFALVLKDDEFYIIPYHVNTSIETIISFIEGQKFELEQYGISKQDYIDALNRAARWTENDFNQGMQNVHPQITKDWAMIELYESIVGYKATYIIDKSGNYPQLVKRTIYMA